jgi:hypothetical protein
LELNMASEAGGGGAPFPVPDVLANDDGWGPSAASIPAHLVDVPFLPFSKNEKLGRCADFVSASSYYNKNGVVGHNETMDIAVPLLVGLALRAAVAVDPF